VTSPVRDVDPPRTFDLSTVQRTIVELNKQLMSLQRQVAALAARVTALGG
jgi:hypothetical protein